MKKDVFTQIALWAVAVLLFLNLAVMLLEPKTVFAEKDPAAAGIGRYQVSAWGAYTGGTTHHYGYYVVDTVTGKIFDKGMEEHKQTE